MEIKTLEMCPSVLEEMVQLYMSVWPDFIAQNPPPNTEQLLMTFAAYQLLGFDGEQLVAAANSLPICYTGDPDGYPDSWDGVVMQSVIDLKAAREPNTLVGLAVGITRAYRGKGISGQMVEAMKSAAVDAGFERLVIPVRPTLKHLYPITPMSTYTAWKRDDGAPFDPWLRVHWRCGATIGPVCESAMTIEGDVKEWETWTGLAFPESGSYVVKGALNPVEIDVAANVGVYRESNVWVGYQIS